MGVSAFFFLPAFVAAFTSAEEFHSVMKTGCPAALSHFASSASCVVFPDPSMPSTTKSFPGYSCGVVRLFSMWWTFFLLPPPPSRGRGASRHLEAQRALEDLLERGGVPVRGPQLELRVARGAQPDHVGVPLRHEVERRDDLRVAAIEPFGQPQHRGED